MAEADQGNLNTPRRDHRIGRCELAGVDPVLDDTLENRTLALEVGMDNLPALAQRPLHHFMHAQFIGIQGRIHPVHGRDHVPQPVRRRSLSTRDHLDGPFDLAHQALGDRLVDRLLGVEKAVHVRRAHPERLGDIGHGGFLIADLPEQPLGRLDDTAAGVGLSRGEGSISIHELNL